MDASASLRATCPNEDLSWLSPRVLQLSEKLRDAFEATNGFARGLLVAPKSFDHDLDGLR